MGYSTDFDGQIEISPPLNVREIAFLTKFNETRRMHRGEGPYYVDGSGLMGQGPDADVVNYNASAAGQPGLWCQWVPTEDGSALVWDGNEKFAMSAEWMKYLIEHFLKPESIAEGELDFLEGHTLNGTIEAQGDQHSDRWDLIVTDNVVMVQYFSMIQSDHPRVV